MSPTNRPRSAILMSGGVDSSTAALLLKRAGHDLVGVTMKIPTTAASREWRCTAAEDAATICGFLDIPHLVVDVKEEFTRLVIEPFRQAYLQGVTPNPCVICNVLMKFDLLWAYARKHAGVETLATGHYARTVKEGAHWHLRRADVETKDQSYFLYRMPKENLENILFPLGQLSKKQVRAMAKEEGLPVAGKSESMDICFLAQGDYRSILPDEFRKGPGPVYDVKGRTIAEHRGIENYTVGQRRGLGFAVGEPVYVLSIDAVGNSITVGTAKDASRRKVHAEKVNILEPDALTDGADLLGKIRSRGEPGLCRVIRASEEEIEVDFASPQFAPTPGQHLVLYNARGDVVAGGVIASRSAPEGRYLRHSAANGS